MSVGLQSIVGNRYPNPLLSKRNIINLNFQTEFNYGFINHCTPADGSISPVGSAFSATASTWGQIIDQNGWPNDTSASGHNFGGGFRVPSSSNFAGPYVLTWDGDGRLNINSVTWTEASTSTTGVGNANGTTTLSGFSSVIGISPNFGISGSGVPGGTTVVSVNYSANTIVVSAAVSAGSGITFTFTNGTYTKNANGKWTNTAGVKPYIVVSNSGVSPNSLLPYAFETTGGTPVSVSSMAWSSGLVTVVTASPHGRPLGYSLSLTFSGATPSSMNTTFTCTMTGASTFTFPLASNPGTITGTITYIAFATNVAVYRQVDEVDFMPTAVGGNGYVFRAPWKQIIVNANPGAIRFLNWFNGNSTPLVRWENRSTPNKAGIDLNAVAGPAYGQTTGTNQYTLAAATATATNPNATPASMVHGEVVQCRIGATSVRSSSNPTAITQANPGVVTAAAHGYSTGDKLIFVTANNNNAFIGMIELNYVPVTVTVSDANTFSLNDINNNPINTTSFTAFAASGNKANATFYPYISLQVGSGNDRIAYPVTQIQVSSQPVSSLGPGVLTSGGYATFYFDKNIAAMRTAGTSLNWTYGVWICDPPASSAQFGFSNGGTPVEYCAAFIAELNILSRSQGGTNPIHMYMTIPGRALLPVDPNYSTASDLVLNMISTCFNGGYGYPGLITAGANLIIEWGNEIWNAGTAVSNYIIWLNYLRSNSAGASTFNFPPMQGLRTALCMRNVIANSPYASRVYKTLGFQGIVAWGSQNQQVALGAGLYFTDPWNTWGSATPISFHDTSNWASYFDVPGMETYTNTVAGTGTFTDDSAMFNGTDNSGNGGGNYAGSANPTKACQNFVNQMIANSSQGIAGYEAVGVAIDGGMSPLSKRHIQYEGGANWTTQTGGGLNSHTITANDTLFLIGIYESQAWANAQVGYFNYAASNYSVGGLQAIFTFISAQTGSTFRWAYAAPDSYASGTEGAALTVNSPLWIAMGARNQSVS